MASALDLSLPSHFPIDISCFDAKPWDNATFALYTVVELPQDKLDALFNFLNERMKEGQDYDPDGDDLVGIPPVYNFAGKSFKDVVHAYTILINRDIIPKPGIRGVANGGLG